MNTKATPLTIGAALVALSALGYSTNPIFGKLSYQYGATAVTLLAIRYSIATTILWAINIMRGEDRGVSIGRKLQLVALGALGMGLVSLLYFVALQHIGASLATGLFYTYPAMVAVIGLVRGEGITRAGLAGLLLTAAGTWLLLGTDLGGFTWGGALMILTSAGMYSLYVVISNSWTRGISPTATSAYVSTGAGLVAWAAVAVTRPAFPQLGGYFSGAGLALCSTILAMIAFFAGLPKVGPTRAAIISTLEPVFTALLAALALRERLMPLQVAGIFLVVLGAVAAQQRERAPAPIEEKA